MTRVHAVAKLMISMVVVTGGISVSRSVEAADAAGVLSNENLCTALSRCLWKT
jgi:hypothetical protein